MPDAPPTLSDDLWGAEFDLHAEKTAVARILEAQAQALGRRTGGIVTGEVVSNLDPRVGTCWMGLYAVVPSMGNYRYKIVTVAHPLGADPENPAPMSAFGVRSEGESTECLSITEFRDWLQDELSSDQVRAVIKGLLLFGRDKAAS